MGAAIDGCAGLTTFCMALTELREARGLPRDSTLHGLYIVITPTPEFQLGDVFRLLWSEPPDMAWGYLMCRRGWGRLFPSRAQADSLAATHKLVTTNCPLAHLFALHVPVMLSPHHEMEPFLVRAPHLVPSGGWAAFFRASGVGAHFSAPRSWQFYAKCWDEDDVLTGKTGGLHMSLHGSTRRCQLMVEYGVLGDALLNTLPHTKQGLLMYMSTMNTQSAARSGDVCYETSLSLSFSALLLAYAETLSRVRRAVYEHPTHPRGGVDYAAREWDYTHSAITRYPVATPPDKPARTLNLASFAAGKAAMWLRAEKLANPTAWASPPALCSKDVHVGMKCELRMWSPGVTTWVDACVTGVDEGGKVSFDVPLSPQCLGLVASKLVSIN